MMGRGRGREGGEREGERERERDRKGRGRGEEGGREGRGARGRSEREERERGARGFANCYHRDPKFYRGQNKDEIYYSSFPSGWTSHQLTSDHNLRFNCFVSIRTL